MLMAHLTTYFGTDCAGILLLYAGKATKWAILWALG